MELGLRAIRAIYARNDLRREPFDIWLKSAFSWIHHTPPHHTPPAATHVCHACHTHQPPNSQLHRGPCLCCVSLLATGTPHAGNPTDTPPTHTHYRARGSGQCHEGRQGLAFKKCLSRVWFDSCLESAFSQFKTEGRRIEVQASVGATLRPTVLVGFRDLRSRSAYRVFSLAAV